MNITELKLGEAERLLSEVFNDYMKKYYSDKKKYEFVHYLMIAKGDLSLCLQKFRKFKDNQTKR